MKVLLTPFIEWLLWNFNQTKPLSYYHSHVFTSHTILHLPDGLPLEAQSLLTQLLTSEPSERLGAGKDGIEEIKRHPYFKQIDWRDVYDSWAMPD